MIEVEILFCLLVFSMCPFCVWKEEDHRQIQKSGMLLFEKLLMKPFENDFVDIVHSVNSMSDHHARNVKGVHCVHLSKLLVLLWW